MRAARKPIISITGLNSELAKALSPVKQSVEMITGARLGMPELKGLPAECDFSDVVRKINEIIARLNASGEYKVEGK